MSSTCVKPFTDFERYITARKPPTYRKHPTWIHPYKVLEAYITGNCPSIYVFRSYYQDFLSRGQQTTTFKEFCKLLDPLYEKRSIKWLCMEEKERAEEIVEYLITMLHPTKLSEVSYCLTMMRHRLEYLAELLDEVLFKLNYDTKISPYSDPSSSSEKEDGSK